MYAINNCTVRKRFPAAAMNELGSTKLSHSITFNNWPEDAPQAPTSPTAPVDRPACVQRCVSSPCTS